MKELSLREIQLGSLEILKKIDKLCIEQGLTYFLIYGTLIGAIRHNGFIPWDDDIDIAMPRPDYEKFLDYLRNNNDKSLELIHYSTNEKYVYPIARVSDPRYHVEYHNVENYGLGLFVDVYPFDGWGNTLEEGKKIEKSFNVGRALIALNADRSFVRSFHGGGFRNILKRIAYIVAKALGSKYLLKHADLKAQRRDYNQDQYVGNVCWNDMGDLRLRYKKRWLKPILHEFEGGQFYIPEGYDDILKTSYGNYMEFPPVEDQVPHHNYKVYKIDD